MASQIGGELGGVEGSGSSLELDPEPPREACKKNPMLIDVILANMFEFLGFEDLSQCRRVSKQWHKVSLPGWLTKAPTLALSLDPTIKPQKQDLSTSVRVRSNMNSFFRLVHNEFHPYGPYEFLGLRQFRNFLVVGNASDEQQHHYLQQFFRVYGHCVTELQLDVEIPDLETYRALMLSTMTPNLAKLNANVKSERGVLQQGTFEIMDEHDHKQLTSLQIKGDDGFVDRDYLTALPGAGWSQLLQRYPNLKTLFVGDPTTLVEDEAITIDRVLLCLAPAFRDAQLGGLETLFLPLGKDTSTGTIYELLNSQAGTLKKLLIRRLSPLANFKPPEMPNLLSLELQGIPIPNFGSLALSFKNLKSLFITCPSSVEASPMDKFPEMLRNTRDGLVLPSLAKLHYDSNNLIDAVPTPLTPKDVNKLAKLFPNLTHLQLWLNNGTLASVLQNWPALQHLTIVEDEIDDEGIGGIVPHLSRMQDLKSLTIKHYDEIYNECKGPTALTGKSLTKFLLLPKLEKLELTLDSEVDVEDHITRNLNKKLRANFTLDWAAKSKWEEEEEGDEDGNENSSNSSSSNSSSSSSDNDEDNVADDSDNDDED